MKFSVAFLFVAIIGLSSFMVEAHQDHSEDFETRLNQAITECTKEHPISKDAVKGIMNHVEVADDKDAKCWISCLMNKMELIKEGKFVWENIKNCLSNSLKNEEDKAKAEHIVELCQSEVSFQVSEEEKDECEMAYSLAVCKNRHWKELGLPVGHYDE